jgi:hypothetical protein
VANGKSIRYCHLTRKRYGNPNYCLLLHPGDIILILSVIEFRFQYKLHYYYFLLCTSRRIHTKRMLWLIGWRHLSIIFMDKWHIYLYYVWGIRPWAGASQRELAVRQKNYQLRILPLLLTSSITEQVSTTPPRLLLPARCYTSK